MSFRALFGGTFDPIHLGHIKTALSLIDEIGISKLHLMPNAVPPHREQPRASAAQRLKMVDLACRENPKLIPEPFELTAAPPSYTINTLRSFKQRYPSDTLLFVMGMDSLVSLDKWYHWQQLTDVAHLVVMPRPNYDTTQASPSLSAFIGEHYCEDAASLTQAQHGCIYIAHTPHIDISATAIREQLNDQQRNHALPAAVANYIRQQQLYR